MEGLSRVCQSTSWRPGARLRHCPEPTVGSDAGRPVVHPSGRGLYLGLRSIGLRSGTTPRPGEGKTLPCRGSAGIHPARLHSDVLDSAGSHRRVLAGFHGLSGCIHSRTARVPPHGMTRRGSCSFSPHSSWDLRRSVFVILCCG
jgi:hypothetical protein